MLEERWTLHLPPEETREIEKREIACVNACEELGIDSDFPPEDRDLEEITPETSFRMYRDALRRKDCPPVVVGMPHSGELVPKEVLPRVKDLKPFGDRGGLDVGTISIFAPRQAEYPAIRPLVSRVTTDLNRGPEDYEAKPPFVGGVTWLKSIDGQDIYNEGQEPTKEEMAKWVKEFYNPYYKAMQGMVGTFFDRGEKDVLVVDGHSFPGDVDIPSYGVKAEDPKPLFIIGTRDDTSAAEELIKTLYEALEELVPDDPELLKGISEKVAANTIFKGVRNVKYWGEPGGLTTTTGEILGKNSHCIQVEVNNLAYMKDGKYNKKHLDILHDVVAEAIRRTAEKLKEL